MAEDALKLCSLDIYEDEKEILKMFGLKDAK